MSCPTCDGTLATLVIEKRTRYAHCDRCGTVVVTDLDKEEAEWDIGQRAVYVPKLVERCREFELVVLPRLIGVTAGTGTVRGEWQRIGLAESINPPGKRPV